MQVGFFADYPRTAQFLDKSLIFLGDLGRRFVRELVDGYDFEGLVSPVTITCLLQGSYDSQGLGF